MLTVHGWRTKAHTQLSLAGVIRLGIFRRDWQIPLGGIGEHQNPKPQVRIMMFPPHISTQVIIATYCCRLLILLDSVRRFSVATRHRNKWVHHQVFWNNETANHTILKLWQWCQGFLPPRFRLSKHNMLTRLEAHCIYIANAPRHAVSFIYLAIGQLFRCDIWLGAKFSLILHLQK